MNIVYLSTGGNLGDRKKSLMDAQNHLRSENIKLLRASSFYETEPWGKTNQNRFLNQVLKIETDLKAHELLEVCLRVEKKMGRERLEKWGERIIDIDIVFFGQEIIFTDRLTIPHPHLENRKFVLVPFCEIDPDFVHPVFSLKIEDLLSRCKDELLVTRFE